MNVTSNIFSLIAIDTVIAIVGFTFGYIIGTIGLTKLEADVAALKAIVYPNTTVTPIV